MSSKKVIPIVLLSDRLYVPAKYVDLDRAEKLYRKQLFKEEICRKCEYKEDRVSEPCIGCDGFIGDFKLYKETEVNDKPYVAVPRGNPEKLDRLLRGRKYKVKDQTHPGKSFKKLGLKFYRKMLRDYQLEATEKMLDTNGGLLKSAPRTGKTVMAISMILKRQVKTIIIVHQEDLLKQFRATLLNEDPAKPQFTNIPEVQKFNGKKYVGWARTYEDFKRLPIALCTYQTFISKGGKKLLKKVVDLPWGNVIVDEVHRANADCFAAVVNSFKAQNRWGLTATPSRKDGKHFIIRDIMGPVKAKTKAKPLPLTIDVVETGLHTNKNYRAWHHAMNFLIRDKKRHDLIVRHAVREVKAGRSVLIPITYQKHADMLVRDINKKAGRNIAAKFTGQLNKRLDERDKLIKAARDYKIKVVVAMRSMLTGIDVPRWDTIFEVIPINNESNLEQELLRVCTPDDKKQPPMVRWFVDDFNISRSCFGHSVRHMRSFKERLGGMTYTDGGAEVTKKILTVHYGNLKQRAARQSGNWDEQDKPWRRQDAGNKGRPGKRPSPVPTRTLFKI